MRDDRKYRASLVELAGDCPALSGLTRRETALAARTIEELIEIVRDLTRRVAMCEIELAGRCNRSVAPEDDY